MARTRKQPPTETQEIPLDRPKRKKSVEELKANPAITTASQLPAQLEPAQPVLEPLKAEQPPSEQERIQPSPETSRPRPSPHKNGTDTGFAAKVVAERPKMQAVPQGFHNVASYPVAGMRVNKSTDKKVVAIQFAEDRLPDRGEKDLLEALGKPDDEKLTWRGLRRQWEREATETYGANIIDAVRLAEGIVKEREGRSR